MRGGGLMRTMFIAYLTLILAGIAYFTAIGFLNQ
ncbi:MAG: hypothetical protein QOJ97_1586 [Solirubrobacteraceae bacterium]|jgi:hypothetical protein|nr:hypothetical protein [Solirubrobacteraceae bacterium]